MSGYWQQPQPMGYGPPGYGPMQHEPPRRRGLPTWVIVLLVLLVIGAIVVIALCAGVTYMVAKGPPTAAVPGTRVRQAHLDQIEQLALIEPGETIKFFYSDAMVDITEGMYFFTDRAVVIYSTFMDPDEPFVRLEYADIIDITHEDSDSFWVPSNIWIETADEYFYFPVSNEAGGDEKFFDLLRQTWEAQRGAAAE